MSLFNDYESELKQTFKLIREKIAEWKTVVNKRTVADQIQAELEVAQDTIDNMHLIVQSTHNGEQLRQKVKGYEKTLGEVRDEWQRSRLLVEDPQREKMSGGLQTLKKTSERIAEAERLGLESEEIGRMTAERLRSDNTKLEDAYDEMNEIGGNVTHSRSILGRMTRRAIYSKLILTLIIVAQILAIIVIIGVKWIRPLINRNTNAPTMAPTLAPTMSPTFQPTFQPTMSPTFQ